VLLTFSMISERRVHQPYGMEGGEPGEAGANYWVRATADGGYRWLSVGPRGQVDLQAGDRFVVHTPCGGGWGQYDDSDSDCSTIRSKTMAPRQETQYPRAAESIQNFADSQAASS
jgi:5-oxoprolinase (ATP-hydrolysing)